MTAEPSPRPWRVEENVFGTYIVAADGRKAAQALTRTANAALIVDAVNERDRLRDIVRRFCDLFTPGTIHPDGTMERLIREARAAIGEDRP